MHREWRQALLKVQTEINENEEQREREAEQREKERVEEEAARKTIAERKQRKLERRRSAESTLSSSLPDSHNAGNSTGLSPPSSAQSTASFSPPNSFDSLSNSARSSSEVATLTLTDSQTSWADVAAIATPHSNERQQPRPQPQLQHQSGALSETDEDGSSDYDERAGQMDNGPLIMRRASTRSMSLDESEMTQMRAGRMVRLQSYGAEAAAGGNPSATAISATAMTPATGGEHRKLTDPLPSSQLSATPSSYPSAVQQREKAREDEERVRRAEEKAAAYLRAQKSKVTQLLGAAHTTLSLVARNLPAHTLLPASVLRAVGVHQAILTA